VDNAGDLCIVTNEFNSETQVLVSDLAQRRPISYLKVKLLGTKSNRSGLGARVTVSAEELNITKMQDGKSGYLAQSVLPLYFGLGDAKHVKTIQVEWPSGYKQTVSNPKLNTTVEIVEGGRTMKDQRGTSSGN